MVKKSLRVFMLAMLLSISSIALADDAAPVYDADNLPRQFDGQMDSMASGPAASDNSFGQRLQHLEQQVNSANRAAARIENLQDEVQTLRAQVEELTHQLQQAKNQQKAMYAELDKRIANQLTAAKVIANNQAVEDDVAPANASEANTKPLPVKTVKKKASVPLVANDDEDSSAAKSTSKSVASAVKAKDSDSQPDVAEEQQTYQTAYNLIKAKKYNEAVTALQKMLAKYPSGQFAANAHYWLGELYGLMNKNDKSAVEFATVVKNYADSPKVPDAQVKLGLIYAAQFKWIEAKATFRKVVSKYPGSSSARLAAEQLKQIKLAGH